MQAFIQRNTDNSLKPFSEYAALREVVGKWYATAPMAQSDKSCTRAYSHKVKSERR